MRACRVGGAAGAQWRGRRGIGGSQICAMAGHCARKAEGVHLPRPTESAGVMGAGVKKRQAWGFAPGLPENLRTKTQDPAGRSSDAGEYLPSGEGQ